MRQVALAVAIADSAGAAGCRIPVEARLAGLEIKLSTEAEAESADWRVLGFSRSCRFELNRKEQAVSGSRPPTAPAGCPIKPLACRSRAPTALIREPNESVPVCGKPITSRNPQPWPSPSRTSPAPAPSELKRLAPCSACRAARAIARDRGVSASLLPGPGTFSPSPAATGPCGRSDVHRRSPAHIHQQAHAP